MIPQHTDLGAVHGGMTAMRPPSLLERCSVVAGLLCLVLFPLLAGIASFKISAFENRGQTDLNRHREIALRLTRVENDLLNLRARTDSSGRTPQQVLEDLRRHSSALATATGFDSARSERLRQMDAYIGLSIRSAGGGELLAEGNFLPLLKLIGVLKTDWDAHLQVLSAAADKRAFLTRWLYVLVWSVSVLFVVAAGFHTHRAVQNAQSRIRRSEGNSNRLLLGSPDGLLCFAANGTVLQGNPAAERLFGMPESRILRRPVDELVPGLLNNARRHGASSTRKTSEDKEASFTMLGNNPEGGSFPLAIKLTRIGEGSERSFLATFRTLSLADGADDLLAAATADLAGETGSAYLLKLAEAASRTLNCAYAAVVDMDNSGADFFRVVALIEDGQKRASESFSFKGSFIEAMPLSGRRLVAKRAREEFPADTLLRRWNASGCYGLALSRMDGHLPRGFLILADKNPLPQLEIQSITENRIAWRAAAELENHNRMLELAAEKECLALTLRSIGDGMITTDPAGQILMINPTGERLTGLSESEAIGRNLSDVFKLQHEITRADLPDPLLQLSETGQTVSPTSVILLSANRSEATIQFSVAPIQDRTGMVAGFVLVFHDLTEARIADEERYRAERLESIGILAGGIAHDFNNLLTGIVGNISLALGNTPSESPMHTRLRDAENASLRAKDLASQLLTFAKGGAPVRRPGPLAKVVEETTHFSMRDPKIHCSTEFAEDLWWAEIDESQISQVIANLVINAQQAMPLGGRIQVKACNFVYDGEDANINLPAGRFTRVTIHDEGTGIPPKYLARIFDPYFTTKPKGSGLGLATSYSIIRNHGGTIVVHSEMGLGTTFDIFLPAVDALATEPPQPVALPKFQVVRPGRVLVMDDEEIICDLIKEALTPLGLEVHAKHESSTALEAYRQALEAKSPYDLVILDLTLPGDMGGQEVMQQLKRLDPAVCAIVSSGYANTPIMSDHRAYGFAGMLPKPYRISDLVTTVQNILSKNESSIKVA